ncbi:MAG TPA: Pr6Pr family membrane protein [Novosphingobium sp.]|nr:Pr6Pr family membrane protein [Novosphingobium sp.]
MLQPKIARLLAAIIALLAWTGLAIQFQASFTHYHTVAATLWVMLLYFTVIVNLLVAIFFSATALGYARLATPFRLAAVTIAILLVGVVYNLLLNGLVELSGGAIWADLINHSITPAAVTLFWLLIAKKGGLRWNAPPQWALLPVVYFAYALVRGSTEGKYPYPFMDVAQLGWRRTLVNAAAMALAFLIVGYAMVWLDRRLAPARSR